MSDKRCLVERLRSVDESWHDHQCSYCDGCQALRREAADEIERLTRENSDLHDEISFYEALANDDDEADYPHRDGRFRDWLRKKLREQFHGCDNERQGSCRGFKQREGEG